MENMHHIQKADTNVSLPASSSMLKFFFTMYFGRNYFNFKGRASRREWWSVAILETIFLIIPIVALMYVFPDYADYIELFYELYALIPSTALMVRRFHDFNMNPWWSLLIVPMFFLPFFKGDKVDNRYGKNIYN